MHRIMGVIISMPYKVTDFWPGSERGVLIRDLAGDLYVVPDPSALDKHSRSLLWAFVD